MTNLIAWNNACYALNTHNQFSKDLAQSVSNDNSVTAASRWFLTLTASFLNKHDDPWSAYDFAECDYHAIAEAWPVIHKSLELNDAPSSVAVQLARFICERLPAVWGSPSFIRHSSLTQSLVLADRTDTLVGLFKIGLSPNGSKDPFALRRAAKHWLYQVIFPITVGLRED